MNRQMKRMMKSIQAMSHDEKGKLIQAMSMPEGINFPVAMSSLLDGEALYSSDDSREYKTYSSQVAATQKKYNGNSDFGVTPVRTVINTRTSFISGEGISINPGKSMSDDHINFINDFITVNKLSSVRLFDIVRQTELAGYAIPFLSTKNELGDFPKVKLLPLGEAQVKPRYADDNDLDSVDGLRKKDKSSASYQDMNLPNFVFIRTGGDGNNYFDFTTKVGVALHECDSQSKALADIRKLNYVCARITPSWETKSKGETDALTAWLSGRSWKIGDAFIGTAKFSYESPGTGALANLKDELAATTKAISATTGVPVHWLGWVDLMSNRATAAELFNSINNATISERLSIADGLKDLIVMAQQLHIDNGGKRIKEMNLDFEVSLPLIDFGRFKEMVESYNTLYNDDVISLRTYRQNIPGINPLFEDKQMEDEQSAESEKSKVTETKIIPEEKNEDE